MLDRESSRFDCPYFAVIGVSILEIALRRNPVARRLRLRREAALAPGAAHTEAAHGDLPRHAPRPGSLAKVFAALLDRHAAEVAGSQFSGFGKSEQPFHGEFARKASL